MDRSGGGAQGDAVSNGGGLYDTDILAGSEQQLTLLRRQAAGERSNDETPDWPSIIEEIESVGNEQS